MVLAMSEGWHLQDPGVSVAVGLELLRKDRVRYGCVRGRRPTVCDHNARIAVGLQQVLKVLADSLDRVRVYRPIVAWTPHPLDPDSPEDRRVVVLKEIHKLVQKTDSLPPVATGRAGS